LVIRAPKALARITKVETAIGQRLPKLQAREKALTSAGHTKLAARVEKRITRLQKVDSRVATLATKIETRCPSAATT
jgi:division protein CdvB (Snf7/Vps24/ESCRT-III family)